MKIINEPLNPGYFAGLPESQQTSMVDYCINQILEPYEMSGVLMYAALLI